MTVADAPVPPSAEVLSQAALDYTSAGLEVFPVNGRTKAPFISQKEATTDPDKVADWWRRFPRAVIGCRVPADVVILDVDARHGGLKTWKLLKTAHDPLPETRTHLSGRSDGGGHLWFKRPSGKLSIAPLDAWARDHDTGHATQNGWKAGIDLLTHGHRYSILPPSPHPVTNKPYWWRAEHGVEMEPAEMPGWLAELITEKPKPVTDLRPLPRDEEDSIADWFSKTYTWGQILGDEGWTLVSGDGESDGSKWRHPSATAQQSASIKHECLFVYSTNTDFEPTAEGDPHGYKRFRAYAVLAHRGDMSAAAREIRSWRQPDGNYELPATLTGGVGAEAPVEVDEAVSEHKNRMRSGATFVLDDPAELDPIWGAEDEVLWASGESLLLVGPTGVGKTTVALQVLAGRLGIVDSVLGMAVTPEKKNVLYLAMDRPRQVRRAMRRIFGEKHRAVLDERLKVWEGPLSLDIGRAPEILLETVHKAEAGTVFIDSLKDAAVKLTDDEVGGNLNRAIQFCLADGIDVFELHHQRKGQGGARPTTLEDVYGSTWITAGAGSVVLLWGSAGDAVIELSHLKQPASPVGPLKIETNHDNGWSSVSRGWDPLVYLNNCGRLGCTAKEAARAMFDKSSPTETERKKAERKLNRLVDKGYAHHESPNRGGFGGTDPGRYFASGALPESNAGATPDPSKVNAAGNAAGGLSTGNAEGNAVNADWE